MLETRMVLLFAVLLLLGCDDMVSGVETAFTYSSEVLSDVDKDVNKLSGKSWCSGACGPLDGLDDSGRWRFVAAEAHKDSELRKWRQFPSGGGGWGRRIWGRFIQLPSEFGYIVGHFELWSEDNEKFRIIFWVPPKAESINKRATLPATFKVQAKIQQKDDTYFTAPPHTYEVKELNRLATPEIYNIQFKDNINFNKPPVIIIQFSLA